MLSLRWKQITLSHQTHPDNIAEFLATSRDMSLESIGADILHDPFLMPDIEKAVQRILQAKKNRERIMIFWDYDVDGVSSTAALFLFLRDELGLDVSYRLPHRVKDGYGMKVYHIEEIAATGAHLLITVDCGTKDIEPIRRATELGLDVIVTDHHSCPAILPECIAVVNPRRHDSLYPFTGLSWSGVVWKVIHALSLSLFWIEKIQQILKKYVDIVSLGTVADCMPMIDENRTIVRMGLAQANNSHHPFFQTFSGILNRPLTTEDDIGFFVWPMLNAGGRITTPYQSINTILASPTDVYGRIQELMIVNETRKGLSRSAYERAIESVDLTSPCILYIDETLEHGILGLVAAKLCELFHRPVGVFTRDGESYVGSFRAPVGIDLVRILDVAAPHLLRYGGHAGAAGCTILVDSFPQAQDTIIVATSQLYDMRTFVPRMTVDTVLDITRIDHNFMEQVESLRPFGQSFDAPLFMLKDISYPLSPLGQTWQHFKWEIETKGFDIIGFNLNDIIGEISDSSLHVIWKLSTHVWRDTKTIQFQVVDAVKV
jgi:single-stranded-DNA-specific exonuclease